MTSDPASLSPRPRVPPRKTLIFSALTLLVALGWIAGTRWVSREVGSINFSRVFFAGMTASLSQSPAAYRSPFGSLLEEAAEQQRLQLQQTEQQVAFVEVVVAVWRWTMYVIAGVLILIAVLTAYTLRSRRANLAAGFLILLSTAGTAVGLYLLAHPELGGFPPSSPLQTALVLGLQSIYGIVLLIAFARRPRPAA